MVQLSPLPFDPVVSPRFDLYDAQVKGAVATRFGSADSSSIRVVGTWFGAFHSNRISWGEFTATVVLPSGRSAFVKGHYLPQLELDEPHIVIDEAAVQ